MGTALTEHHFIPEIRECPGRYHNTANAARKAGCLCPKAVAAWRASATVGVGPNRDNPRWRDIDPIAIQHAIAGLIPAAKLTTDERRQAVHHLAVVQRLTDRAIAQRLRWTGWDTAVRPEAAVTKFRLRWAIPTANWPTPNPERQRRRGKAAAA